MTPVRHIHTIEQLQAALAQQAYASTATVVGNLADLERCIDRLLLRLG